MWVFCKMIGVCIPLFDLIQISGTFPFHASRPRCHADDHSLFLKMFPSFELKTHLISVLLWWFLLPFIDINGANPNKVQPQKKQVYQQRLQKEEKNTTTFPISKEDTERLNYKIANLYQGPHYFTIVLFKCSEQNHFILYMYSMNIFCFILYCSVYFNLETINKDWYCGTITASICVLA